MNLRFLLLLFLVTILGVRGLEEREIASEVPKDGPSDLISPPQPAQSEARVLYNQAIGILHRVKPVKRVAKTHFHNTKLSGPAQVIDYAARTFRDLLNGRSPWGSGAATQTGGEPATPKKRREGEIEKQNTVLLDTAVSLLEEVSDGRHGNDSSAISDSLFLLGDMNMFSNYTHARNFSRAVMYYTRLADFNGNSSAQFMVGLAHSTGLFGTVPVDQAKATIYYTASAYNGDIRAQMAMGFRHLAGIGVPVKEDQANLFYRSAARQSIEYYLNGPGPLGRKHLNRASWIIPDETSGGVYGEGASEISSGKAAEKRKQFLGGAESIEQAMEYFHYLADESQVITAHLALARLYYEGGRNFDPDYKTAVSYALRCTSYLWTSSGELKPRAQFDDDLLKHGIKCASFVGQRYLRGEGLKQNTARAVVWFQRAMEFGDAEARTEIGSLNLLSDDQAGFETNEKRGVGLLVAASADGHYPASARLARYHWNNGNIVKAIEYARSATELHGGIAVMSTLDALYILGEYYSTATHKNYDQANRNFRLLTEQIDSLHSPLMWAQRKYREGDVASAILGFLIAAEQGYESAQFNVAFLLDNHQGYIPLLREPSYYEDAGHTALVYWTRASKQSNVDAQIKMGDYYFDGIGTEEDYEKAAQCYSAAADGESGIGNWNLGWMYESGLGVAKDYHLAKRYYDLALLASPEAFLPVKLSLLRLYAKSYLNTLVGGKVRSIVEETQPNMGMRELWRVLWKKWSEMEFSIWDELDEDYDDGVYDLLGSDDEDGLYISSLIVVVLTAIFVALWLRQRRRQEQIRQAARATLAEALRNRAAGQAQPPIQAVPLDAVPEPDPAVGAERDETETEETEAEELRRRLGAHLGDPDENAVPVLYM